MAPQSFLKVLGGPLDGRELILQDDASEVLVGGDASCHLRLELPGVSPIHARVKRDPGGTTVYEAGSPGPIYVNDDLVRGRAPLRSGDILWLGPPGEAQSVMIQCRLASAPTPIASAAAPAPASAGTAEAVDEPFFIADPQEVGPAAEEIHDVEHIDAFLVAPADPAAATEDAFYFEEPPPAAAAAGSDEFFISEPEPLSAAEAPPAPAAVTPALPPAPAPAMSRAPAPPSVPAASSPASAAGARPAAKPAPPRAASAAKPSPTPARRPAAAGPAARSRVSAEARRPPSAAPAPRRTAAPASSPVRYAALAAAALAILAGAGFFALRALNAPSLQTVSPNRAKVGQVVTLAGRHFSASRDGNRVLFGERPGTVVEASATQIQTEVPELPTTAGRDLAVPVTVEAGGRKTNALELAVYQSPRIHGLSPDVAMPGAELTLAGSGWGPGAVVYFGSQPAELLMTSATALRVRVPVLEGTPGTTVPVSVALGGDRSNEAPFMIGRLPLLHGIAPSTAAPGELVTLRGRGLHAEAQRNAVSIAGVRALVVGSNAGELQVMVPFAAAGEAVLEVRVSGAAEVARAVLNVAAPADSVEWRFVAEPFEDAAGHVHASLSTALGPAFVLSSAGGRTAAERAVEATRHLNEAAAILRASLDADFRARGPAVYLVPKETPVLEAAAEDAAGYSENWTGSGGRGPVAPERLAQWWAAIARDLVLILLRNQKPEYAAGLGAEGRILGEVFLAGRRSGQFGLSRQMVMDLKPAQRQALRVLAQRVPAALAGPALGGQTGAGAAGATPLRLQGRWTGFEAAESSQKLISVTFGRSGGGTLTFTEGVSIGVPLLSAETPQRNTVRFSAQVRGGVRYYLGTWNGEKLSGRITTDPAGRNAVGRFELTPGI